MSADVTILVPARDEENTIGATVAALRGVFPGVPVIVGDDGSRDGTAAVARAAGARVVSGPRLGKGEALNAAERVAAPGPLLLCDADLRGDLSALCSAGVDVAIARFVRRQGGGIGLARETARGLIRARTGRRLEEPLSGQRYLSERARAACFPLARGFGCEVRLTIDALLAGLSLDEIELDLTHRPTLRDLAGFRHRGTQLVEAVLACGPLACNHRGNRLPVLGAVVAAGALAAPHGLAVLAIGTIGLVDDLFTGPERGLVAHLRAGSTTGVLKLVAIPAVGALAARSVSGGLVVGLAANALNQLDTRPGRALKAFLGASLLQQGGADGATAVAVLLLPYDLRERLMLGDGGSNALGAVLGLRSVARLSPCGRWTAVGILAGLNLLGERRSLGALIETTPILRELDAAGTVR